LLGVPSRHALYALLLIDATTTKQLKI